MVAGWRSALCDALCAVAPPFGWLLALRILGGVITAFAGSLPSVAVTALVAGEAAGPCLRDRGGRADRRAGAWRAPRIGGVGHSSDGARPSATRRGLRVVGVADPACRESIRYRTGVGLRTPSPEWRHSRVFGLTVLGVAAAFTIVAYLGPIINHLTGVSGAGVEVLQAFIGVGSLVGLAAGGLAADRRMIRAGLMIAFAVMALDMSVYYWALGLPPHTTTQPLVAGLIFLLATTMFAAVPIESRPTLAVGRGSGPRRLGAQWFTGVAQPRPWRDLGRRHQ